LASSVQARTVDAEFGQQMLTKRVQNVVEFREHLVGVWGVEGLMSGTAIVLA